MPSPPAPQGVLSQNTTTKRYLDEALHIAVKQLMVIHGTRPRLPHFLWFRGKGGGPGKWWTKGTKISHCV